MAALVTCACVLLTGHVISTPHMTVAPAAAAPIMFAKKTSWSVGHARKKGKKGATPTAASARAAPARGFGVAAAEPKKIDDTEVVAAVAEDADAEAKRLAEWREYCASAMAAAEEAERQAGGSEQKQLLSLFEVEE